MSQMKDEWVRLTEDGSLPSYPPFGLTSQEFADAQDGFTAFARGRILTKGSHYDQDTHQRIEVVGVGVLLAELREELADAVNYLTALDIAVSRMADRLGVVVE